MEQQNIHTGHRSRMKSEYLASGLDGFSDVRALEMLLFYSISRSDTNPLAHALINRFGSLHNVLCASVEELRSVDGVGESTALLIRLTGDIYKKAESCRPDIKNSSVINPEAAFKAVSALYIGCRDERVYLSCLDAKKRLKDSFCLGNGGPTGVSLELRNVVRTALESHCDSCILSHNHPSGDVMPSEEDRILTARVSEALSVIGVALVDHIIVGEGGYFSFAESGLI